MYANLGFYLLFLGCILSVLGVVAAFAAVLSRQKSWLTCSQVSSSITLSLCLIAAALLWLMLFQRDYGLGYIFRNSSNDLPQIYTLTAFWSALEGSHFFWTILVAGFSTIAHWVYSKDNEHIMPYVSMSLQLVVAWMLFLAISYSDIFAPQLPLKSNGQGMNSLLQNPYMAIHPPLLFIGYSATTIPFAYAVAALFFGDITQGWLKTVRQWTLIAFMFLTAGIFLGGRWAYVELGWAGYWAWDPVENSSFMPWLFTMALLHCLLVQDKLGQLKRLSIILAFFAFFFGFFGTFITRSGIIQSVHSFAVAGIGPNYLIFLAALLLMCLMLYAWKAPYILPANSGKVWGVSKESALLITQFLTMSFAVIIFVGTVFPIVSESLTGRRISIQAPYFNTFAPYIGLGFILAIAMGNIMRYQTGKLALSVKTIVVAVLLSLLPAALFMYFGDIFRTEDSFSLGAQIVGIVLCFASAAILLSDFLVRYKLLKYSMPLLLNRNRAYLGGLVAHLGVLIAILGFLGNYRGIKHEATLDAGESMSVYGYDFTFHNQGMQIEKNQNATLFVAPLDVSVAATKASYQIKPAQSKYPTSEEPFTEIAVRSKFWHDLYVVLAGFDREHGKQATFKIHINPTVRIVWLSAFLMVIGGFIALTDPLRGTKSKDHLGGEC